MKNIKNFLLEYPKYFNFFKNTIGYQKITKKFLLLPDIKSGQKILDIGCGNCELLKFLPQVKYLGFDINSKYIKDARLKYGKKGTFTVASIEHFNLEDPFSYDLVIANGVLHHLNDSSAAGLLSLAFRALKTNGILITLDGVKSQDQGIICRLVMSLDRGKYIREAGEYLKLVSPKFSSIEYNIYKNELLIPYHHIALKCKK